MGPHAPGGPVRWVLRIDASGKGRCRGLGPAAGHVLETSCRSGHLGRRGLSRGAIGPGERPQQREARNQS